VKPDLLVMTYRVSVGIDLCERAAQIAEAPYLQGAVLLGRRDDPGVDSGLNGAGAAVQKLGNYIDAHMREVGLTCYVGEAIGGTFVMRGHLFPRSATNG
jgi:hypothetical protein